MFLIFIDPKLRVNQNASKLRLEQVIDEKGNSLLQPWAREQRLHAGGFTSTPLRLSVSLKQPPDAGKRIAMFKAILRLPVETKKEVWEVPNILEAKDIARTIIKPDVDERYLIREVTKRGQSYQVHFTISHLRARQLDGDRSNWEALNFVRLLDGQGRELSRSGHSMRGDGNQLIGDLNFSHPQGGEVGEPVKLVWDIPTEFKAIEVPFEFTDLPLP